MLLDNFYSDKFLRHFAFQNAIHNIISFIILTNMSRPISNNNKCLDKCIFRVLKLYSHETSWLMHRHSVFTVATEWKYVRSVCTVRTVLLVPLILLGIVSVFVDTSAQIEVPKARERPDWT